jgi:hypothetical protein
VDYAVHFWPKYPFVAHTSTLHQKDYNFTIFHYISSKEQNLHNHYQGDIKSPYIPEDGMQIIETRSINSFLIKSTDSLISQIYFVKNLYMFRTVPLPIIRSFPLYVRHWYVSWKFVTAFEHDQDGTGFILLLVDPIAWKLSTNLHNTYKCRKYSGKLLMMGRGTVRNM